MNNSESDTETNTHTHTRTHMTVALIVVKAKISPIYIYVNEAVFLFVLFEVPFKYISRNLSLYHLFLKDPLTHLLCPVARWLQCLSSWNSPYQTSAREV